MVNNRINPDDVPPRRNLPDEAEQWGRWMEDDQNLLKGAVISQGQSLQGLNRSTAASLANISDQLKRINETNVTPSATRTIDTTASNSGNLPTWFTPRPEWASFALIPMSFVEYVSGDSLTGAVSLSIVHRNFDDVGAVVPGITSSAFTLVSGAAEVVENPGCVIDCSGADGLYSTGTWSESTPSTGTATYRITPLVTWIA